MERLNHTARGGYSLRLSASGGGVSGEKQATKKDPAQHLGQALRNLLKINAAPLI